MQPKGNAALLASGVVCALIAVILDGKAYGSLSRRPHRFAQKHHRLHRLRRAHGIVGSVRHPALPTAMRSAPYSSPYS